MKQQKSIKWGIFLLALCVSAISFSQPQHGQRKGSPNGQMVHGGPTLPSAKEIKKMVTDLGKELTLSEAQEELVLAIYNTHFKEVEKVVSKSSRPDKDEMEALDLSFQNEVKQLLDNEQIIKYDVYLKEEQQNRKQRSER